MTFKGNNKLSLAILLFIAAFVLRFTIHSSESASNQASFRQHIVTNECSTHDNHSLKSYRNLPVSTQFSEKRHKRALAENVYMHEPVFRMIDFGFIKRSYNKFSITLISEISYRHPSLR